MIHNRIGETIQLYVEVNIVRHKNVSSPLKLFSIEMMKGVNDSVVSFLQGATWNLPSQNSLMRTTRLICLIHWDLFEPKPEGLFRKKKWIEREIKKKGEEKERRDGK